MYVTGVQSDHDLISRNNISNKKAVTRNICPPFIANKQNV